MDFNGATVLVTMMATLEHYGAMDHTIVVAATASDMRGAGEQVNTSMVEMTRSISATPAPTARSTRPSSPGSATSWPGRRTRS